MDYLAALRTKKVLYFAWGIETVCVAIGLLLAIVIGLEASNNLQAAIMAAAPFAGAAVVELGRIPLIEGMFGSWGLRWKLLFLGAVILFSFLTAENLLFGFERAFTTRVEEVRVKDEAKATAEKLIASLQEKSDKLGASRKEIDGEKYKLAQEIEAASRRANQDTTTDDSRATTRHAQLLEERKAADQKIVDFDGQAKQQTETCLKLSKDRCDSEKLRMKLAEERAQSVAARNMIVEEIVKIGQITNEAQNKTRTARNQEQQAFQRRKADLDKRTDDLHDQENRVKQEIDSAIQAAADAKSAWQASIGTSQMHRFARVVFGSDDTPTTQKMVSIFSLILAIVLSLAGSVLAMAYFRIKTQPGTPAKPKLVPAIRGLIARMRRKHSVVKMVQKPVEVIKEVVVVKEIEKETIVYKDRVIHVEKEVPVNVEKVVVRTVEVPKPELVMVPVPLDANEEVRRQIMVRASRELGGAPIRNMSVVAAS